MTSRVIVFRTGTGIQNLNNCVWRNTRRRRTVRDPQVSGGRSLSQGSESYEPILFDPTGTDLNGVIVVRGSADQLDALRQQDRFIEITMQAAYLCESFGVVNAHLEGQLQARMAKWAQIISQ